MPLTALKVTHARPGRHADMHGLYLLVRDSGARSWVLRMQHAGMRRDFGLGPVHDVSLADARARAADIRRQVRAGLDPAAERPKRRKASPTFEKVTRDCYDAMKGGWKDQRRISWLTSFERHVFPRTWTCGVTLLDEHQILERLAVRFILRTSR